MCIRDREIGAPNEKGEYEDTFVVDPDLRLITLTVTSENEKENKKFVINVKHGEFAIYANAIDNSGLMSSSPVSYTHLINSIKGISYTFINISKVGFKFCKSFAY